MHGQRHSGHVEEGYDDSGLRATVPENALVYATTGRVGSSGPAASSTTGAETLGSPGRDRRHDGWTASSARLFCSRVDREGVVEDAPGELEKGNDAVSRISLSRPCREILATGSDEIPRLWGALRAPLTIRRKDPERSRKSFRKFAEWATASPRTLLFSVTSFWW